MVKFVQHGVRYLLSQYLVGFRSPVELIGSGKFEFSYEQRIEVIHGDVHLLHYLCGHTIVLDDDRGLLAARGRQQQGAGSSAIRH